MKSFTLLFPLALAALAFAQNQFENSTIVPSAPFNLVIHSHNRTLNGTLLASCHEGAAIGALCALTKPTTPSPSFEFRLNYTANTCGYDNGTLFPCTYPGDPNSGILTWDLSFNNDQHVSQSVELVSQGVSSNMAFATVFFPSSGFHTTNFNFDADSKMNLQDGLDRRNPGASPSGPSKAYYRWYLCHNYWMYYKNAHLVWIYGDDKPWDSSCDEVDLRRVFV